LAFSSDLDGFLSVWISLAFELYAFGFWLFHRIWSVFFRFGSLKILAFSLDQIIRALQQYKDAKAFTLPIAYSTGVVKPSIFGIKTPISEFSSSETKCKPLVHKAWDEFVSHKTSTLFNRKISKERRLHAGLVYCLL
jgi:hypothetical protein